MFWSYKVSLKSMLQAPIHREEILLPFFQLFHISRSNTDDW